MSSKDLADLADVFDANYAADGRYRSGNTQDYKPTKPGSFHGTQFPKRVVSIPGETASVLITMQKPKVIQTRGLKFLLARFRAVCVGFVKVPITVNETAHKNHKTNQLSVNNRTVDLIVLNVNRIR